MYKCIILVEGLFRLITVVLFTNVVNSSAEPSLTLGVEATKLLVGWPNFTTDLLTVIQLKTALKIFQCMCLILIAYLNF